MAYNSAKFKKEDLRVIKTRRHLLGALQDLLNVKNFTKLSVQDICEQALVSRAAFYTHYSDKYALLKDLLIDTGQEFLDSIRACGENEKQQEKIIGDYIYNHRKSIMNLMSESDAELLNIMSDFLIHFIGCIVTGNALSNSIEEVEKSIKILKNDKDDLLRASMYTFCAGGILGVLLSYAAKKFPPDSKKAAVYVYKIIKLLIFSNDIVKIVL
jgi:AcrR family transcriptional regulator